MKKLFLFILGICFCYSVFAQQKNIIGIYAGYEYSSDGTCNKTYGGNYKPKEHGFTIAANYERLLKNNWAIGAAVNYSGLVSKSGILDLYYWKYYCNIIGQSFKTSKYFGNMNKFYGFVSWGLTWEMRFNSEYIKISFFWENLFPIFAEVGCGYWITDKWSVFTSFKANYDIVNFFNIKNDWNNYSLNAMLGVKYRF